MNANQQLPGNIRYPLEMPIYVICVFVNVALMIGLAYVAFVPETPATTVVDLDRFVVRAVAAALLTAVPGLIIWRRSHPFTVNRLLALYDAGLFKTYEQYIPQSRRGY